MEARRLPGRRLPPSALAGELLYDTERMPVRVCSHEKRTRSYVSAWEESVTEGIREFSDSYAYGGARARRKRGNVSFIIAAKFVC